MIKYFDEIGRIVIKKIHLWLISILLLGIALRVFSFGGYGGSDDGAYIQIAYNIASDTYKVGASIGDDAIPLTAPVFPLRLGLIYPLVLLIKLFGLNEIALISFSFLLSILNIYVTYKLGKLLFNPTVGLIAAFIIAILPIDVRTSSLVLPDLPSAIMLNIGILLMICGSRRDGKLMQIFYGFASGVFIGVSWLCKESLVYMAPFFIIYSVYLIRRLNVKWLLLSLAFASSSVFISELIYYEVSVSDPFYRFNEINRNYEINKTWFFVEGSEYGEGKSDYWRALGRRLLYSGPRVIFLSETLAYINIIALFSVFFSVVRKKMRNVCVTTWFITLLLVYNFASTNLSIYRPLHLVDRYLYPIILPSLLLSSLLIYEAVKWRGDKFIQRVSKWLLLGLTVAVISTACYLGNYNNINKGKRCKVEREVVHVLSPNDRVFTDRRTAWTLEFFWNYPSGTKAVDFENYRTHEIPKKVYVLINRVNAYLIWRNYGYILPEFYNQPPTGWELIWQAENGELYWKP